MNEYLKSIIDELIDYENNRKPKMFLNEAFDKLGDREIIQPIGLLLLWHKEYFLGLKPADKYEISEILYNRYLKLFELCRELKSIFSLNKDHIGWSLELTEEQKDEIRNYIQENYTIQIRLRRNLRR